MEPDKILLEATLVFLVREDAVLLPLKAQKIGAGCRNGYGGGIDAGETAEQCVLRELSEEAGVHGDASALAKRAVIDFHNTTTDGGAFTCRCHVYLLTAWEGEPVESAEMLDPQWFTIAELPLAELMPADPYWLPPVLAGERVYGEAWYGPKQKTLLRPVTIASLPDSLA